MVSCVYLRLLLFLPAILISACVSSSSEFCMMYSAYNLNKQGTVYSLDVLLSQFWTSPFFHVQFCYFLTCIQVSQEAGKMVWYSHLFKNFPFCCDLHSQDFSVVSEAGVDVFLDSLHFSIVQWWFAIWPLVPLPFLNPAWTSGSSWFTYCWSLTWRILSITLLACESATVW